MALLRIPVARSTFSRCAATRLPLSFTMANGRTYASNDTEGAQPKILNDTPPKAGEEPKEVAEHNKDMERRADKASASVEDRDVEKDHERQKVGKGFWKGESRSSFPF